MPIPRRALPDPPGVPACADSWLLTTVARGEWGFDGYVTTDCGAGEGVWRQHHYAARPQEAVRDAACRLRARICLHELCTPPIRHTDCRC